MMVSWTWEKVGTLHYARDRSPLHHHGGSSNPLNAPGRDTEWRERRLLLELRARKHRCILRVNWMAAPLSLNVFIDWSPDLTRQLRARHHYGQRSKYKERSPRRFVQGYIRLAFMEVFYGQIWPYCKSVSDWTLRLIRLLWYYITMSLLFYTGVEKTQIRYNASGCDVC